MSRWFIELSYDGSNYRGWQRQPDAPTVQGALESALGRLLGTPVEVVGAGRTDTGVHAARYVAHFDLAAPPCERSENLLLAKEEYPRESEGEVVDSAPRSSEARSSRSRSPISTFSHPHISTFSHSHILTSPNFLYHLNAVLPLDVAVSRIWPCDLHARFDAKEREYKYYITTRKDPFRRTQAWQYTVPLDVDAMNKAAAKLLSVSDFTSFAKLGGGNKTNFCRVTHAEWTRPHPSSLVFTIRADRFLRNMVRAIVGTLVDVGRGKLTPQQFEEIVLAKDLSRSSGGAPAHGLFLTDVVYPAGESAQP